MRSAIDDDLGPPLEWLVVEVGAVTSDDTEVIGVPRDVVMGALGPLAPGAALRPPGHVPLTGPPVDGVNGTSAQAAGRLLDLMDSVVRAATDGTLSVRRDGAIGIREASEHLGRLFKASGLTGDGDGEAEAGNAPAPTRRPPRRKRTG